jgi:hypothetical protein
VLAAIRGSREQINLLVTKISHAYLQDFFTRNISKVQALYSTSTSFMPVTTEYMCVVFFPRARDGFSPRFSYAANQKSATLPNADSGTISPQLQIGIDIDQKRRARVRTKMAMMRGGDADAIEADNYAYVLGRTCAEADAARCLEFSTCHSASFLPSCARVGRIFFGS